MIEAAGSKAGPKIKEGECIYDYKYDTAAKTWKNWLKTIDGPSRLFSAC